MTRIQNIRIPISFQPETLTVKGSSTDHVGHRKPFHSLLCHCDVSPLLSLSVMTDPQTSTNIHMTNNKRAQTETINNTWTELFTTQHYITLAERERESHHATRINFPPEQRKQLFQIAVNFPRTEKTIISDRGQFPC
jgi:hypothetical protein